MEHSTLLGKHNTMEQQKSELEEELANSEEMRQNLKDDIEDQHNKFITLEEELFQSKSIQLELLENLK